MDMTVQEYLEFAAELKKLPKEKRESDISEVMKLTRLQDVSDRLIKNLSKGYKQRVGLAQAILGFPEIIILDEPTVGLDPKQIIEIRELIRTLSKKHTVILSSHILAEVREVCDYILIISKGKLVASDTPENLELLRNGASSLELEVKAAPETARAILSTIDDIDAMEMHSENENLTRVKLETKNGADIREAIFYAFAEEKCPLLEMKTAKASLEDIFMELTQKEESNDAGNL
jgi:ABC-2 type transport system ATP-binding protein